MYFELDRNDFIYYHNEILYRLIAKETFITTDFASDEMVRNVVAIHKGEKGGYAGSEFCLEEKLDSNVKPWVYPGSVITSGSILSGASILVGDSEVSCNSIIEGGNIIKDSIITHCNITTKHFARKQNRIILSCIIENKTIIKNTDIYSENIRINGSEVENCIIDNKVGNIRISNTDAKNIAFSDNSEIKDVLLSGKELTKFPENTICNGVEMKTGVPSGMLIRIKKEYHPHCDAWEMLAIDEKEKRGIYRKAVYHPITSGLED